MSTTRGRRTLTRIVGLAVLLLASSLSNASRVRPVDIEELTHLSGTIFSGRCVSTETSVDPELGVRVTRATFAVERQVKGNPQSTITVAFIDGSVVPGMPRFEPGENVVLFLYQDSALGLTSPVGMMQGKFRVYEDKAGGRVAVNGTRNVGLLRSLSTDAAAKLGPAAERWKGKPGIEPSALLDIVELLSAGER